MSSKGPSANNIIPAALLGGLISLSYLIYLTLHANFSSPKLLADGTADDGYTHLMFMGLVLLPGLYLIVCLTIAGIFLALVRHGLFTPVWITIAAASIPNLLLLKLNLSLSNVLIVGLFSIAGALSAWKMSVVNFKNGRGGD